MNLKDSIFQPGLRSGADVGFDIVPEAGWRIGADDGTWEMYVDSETKGLSLTTSGPDVTIDGTTEILVGANATNFAALANLVTAKLNAFKAAISGAATFAGDGGATFKTNIVTALNLIDFNVAATKVKVE